MSTRLLMGLGHWSVCGAVEHPNGELEMINPLWMTDSHLGDFFVEWRQFAAGSALNSMVGSDARDVRSYLGETGNEVELGPVDEVFGKKDDYEDALCAVIAAFYEKAREVVGASINSVLLLSSGQRRITSESLTKFRAQYRMDEIVTVSVNEFAGRLFEDGDKTEGENRVLLALDADCEIAIASKDDPNGARREESENGWNKWTKTIDGWLKTELGEDIGIEAVNDVVTSFVHSEEDQIEIRWADEHGTFRGSVDCLKMEEILAGIVVDGLPDKLNGLRIEVLAIDSHVNRVHKALNRFREYKKAEDGEDLFSVKSLDALDVFKRIGEKFPKSGKKVSKGLTDRHKYAVLSPGESSDVAGLKRGRFEDDVELSLGAGDSDLVEARIAWLPVDSSSKDDIRYRLVRYPIVNGGRKLVFKVIEYGNSQTLVLCRTNVMSFWYAARLDPVSGELGESESVPIPLADDSDLPILLYREDIEVELNPLGAALSLRSTSALLVHAWGQSSNGL